MFNKKGTKHALLMSVISLLLCCSMLIGTTFAWFTDEVKTNNNIIKSGNLDVELYWSTNAQTWSKVDENTNVFSATLWEPGHTEVVYLKVVNEGTLALQYNLRVNIAEETEGTNVYGDKFLLSDYIMFDVIPVDGAYANRDAARKAAAAGATKLNVPYANPDVLLDTNEDDIVAMVVYMPESVDNVANHLTGTKAPEIDLGINLYATQYTKEQDSFGPDYDEDAVYPDNMWVGGVSYDWYTEAEGDTYYISTPADLAGFTNIVNGTAPASLARGGETLPADSFKGKTVKLTANMDLAGILWTPITGFAGTFDGQGHAIANLHIVGNSDVGFFRTVSSSATITNVKFEQAKVYGNHWVGVLIGWEGNESANATISNIKVIDSLVVCEPELVNDEWDNGDKAGAIVGYAVSLNITDCYVENTTIKAYRDFGGIIGYAHKYMNVSDNTVKDLNLVIDNSHNYKNYATDVEHDANLIVGEANANAVIADNTCMIGDVETNIIYTVEDLETALNNGGNYVLNNDIATEATITVPSGVNTVLYMEGKTISGTFSGTGNRDMFLVKGNLTVYNGNITMEATVNQGWNAMADIFDITAGGSVKLENVSAAISGTDMNFIAHLNNWGSASLYVDNCDFTTTYVAIRAFNSGYDMNNITIKNTDFHGGRMFWVHNYTAEGKDDSTLNLDIYGNNNTSDNAKPVRFGFSDSLYYTIEGAPIVAAADQNALNSALGSGNVSVNLEDGSYDLPGVSNGDVTISGSKDTVITVNKPAYHGSNVTFNGVTIKGSGYSTGVQHVNTVTYNDATIVGEMCLYGEKVVFNNCTFELNGQYIWTYGAKEVEFNNCTFNTTGKAILIYNEGAGASKVTVKGCTFNATAGAKAGAIANQNCAAIEIDNHQNSGIGTAHVLITEGNTYSENFSGEWRIKNFVSGNAVTVNGVSYSQIAIDGKLMTIDASKNVTVQ